MNHHTFTLALSSMLAGVALAGQPTPGSGKAAHLTAEKNPLCQAIEPFFWEIGDATADIASGSVGVNSSGAPITASTEMNIASSSKWLYSTYVTQVRGAAANLTDDDVNFLHMTSGYANMGQQGTSEAGTCPSSDNPDTINVCLTLINPFDDLPNDYQNPAFIGSFVYDAGHDENHASLFTTIGNTPNNLLGRTIAAQLGPNVKLSYSQPLLAGGANMTPASYAHMLQHILAGTLAMNQALGIDPVCTLPSATCNAQSTPLPWAWHYSIGHWVEDDPSVNDDGAFSSPGAQGFYPWIEAGKQYYGLLARVTRPNDQPAGEESVQCGQMIRLAWDTGVEQTGTTRDRRIAPP
jgi:hypothetical protein